MFIDDQPVDDEAPMLPEEGHPLDAIPGDYFWIIIIVIVMTT